MKEPLTVREAADQSGFSVTTVQGWILDGQLPAFTSPGRKIGDRRRGQKGYRIWQDDLDRFLAANTRIGKETPVAVAEIPLAPSGRALTRRMGVKA
jgi:excisionase family DNA binding protein